MGLLRSMVLDAIYVDALATELGLGRRTKVADRVQVFLATPEAASWEPRELGAAVRLAGELPPSASANLRAAAALWPEPRTMDDAFGQWFVARATGDSRLQERAQAIAMNLRVGSAFEPLDGAGAADLRSTMMGRLMLGETQASGVEAANLFLDSTGIWLRQPDTGHGNVVSLESYYLAITLAGLSSDEIGTF